MHCIVGPR